MVSLANPVISRSMKVLQLHAGNERRPVLQMDGLLHSPQDLRTFAVKAHFEAASKGYYPGIYADIPQSYVRHLMQLLDPVMRAGFHLGKLQIQDIESRFSLVTTPRHTLQPLQTVPHIDTSNPWQFAALLYLCQGNFGGTSFFRQTATGFETISPERSSAWTRARDAALETADADSDYIGAGNDDYQKTMTIPVVFNRLIIYRSNMLHSGDIAPSTVLSDDPAKGRLTANLFVSYG